MSIDKLQQLIPQYAMNKAELDSYEKICKRDNEEIKSLMFELGIDEAESEDYVAKRTVQKRENINEAKLLEIAHHYGIPEIVKVKEYIDYDALENALYNNLIPTEAVLEMNNAKTVKEVVTLRVTKRKKKGED